MNDQAKRLRQLVKEKSSGEHSAPTIEHQPEIITISSGKGGVGKSVLAVNLSFALRELNKKILLIDGNFGLFNLDILLGIQSNPKLEQLLRGEIDFREAIINVYPGIDLICGGTEYRNLQKGNSSRFEKGLAFVTDIKRTSDYDFIIIDTGSGVKQTVFSFADLSDQCIVLTTPELAAVTDTYALVKSLVYVGVASEVNLVVNMCHKEKEAVSTWKNLNKVLKHYVNYEINLLGYILEDSYISTSIKRQQPALMSEPNTSSGIAIKNLARKLLNVKASCQG
ncbi:P-loop NTPase [Natranaerobius thermophilus]|uniref:Flagellar number regulator n=1 Tax=Natranaerobius thermophilus (strain ATCC BAA-1301 / DSM 18059 / JW/NM-WN-LF) TaxID=457570 RepID=B2A368_NATTJ|nr:P-loop NTPase [Natranaerobius thermophilus]ACB84998.1 flagellar number regulator [Natranaerobius thermophilus JW/NM-WN-LF]